MSTSEKKPVKFNSSLDVLRVLRAERGLTFSEIADLLGVTRAALYNAIKTGVLSVRLANRIAELFPEYKERVIAAKRAELMEYLTERVGTKYDSIFDVNKRAYYALQFRVPVHTREWLAGMSLNHNTSIAEVARRVLLKAEENHTANTAAVNDMAEKWVKKNKDALESMTPEYAAKIAFKAGFNRSKVR